MLLWGVFAARSAEAEPRTLRVGAFQVEPLTFVQDDKPKGLFIDLLEEVASEQGWRLVYSQGSFEAQLAALERGDLDLMPVIAWSADRSQVLDYTQEPVLTLWGEVFVRQGAPVPSLLELEGKRVALMTSDINGQNFREYAEKFDINCQFLDQETLEGVFAAVRAGAADAGVAPNVFGYRHAQRFDVVSTPIVFSPISVHFAARKGQSADALASLDRALSAWKAEEDSFYRDRLAFWLGGEELTKRLIPRWLPWGVLGALGIALSMVVYNRVLESRVRARTQELASSERRFRALFDNQFQLAGLLTPSGTLLEANAASLAVAGISAEEVLGRPFWDCPWWNHDPGLQARVRQAVQDAASGRFVRFDAIHKTPKGQTRHIDFSIKPVFDAEGKVELLVPEGRDITDHRELEADLRHAQKMEAIGTLAGGIAHDFNNILTAIAGSAELARMELGEHNPIEEDLECIRQGTQRARELVHQILTFSRKRQLERGPVELATVLSETQGLLRPSLPSTITIRQTIETRGPIIGDAFELQRLIMNLGTNALHAMPHGGALTFELKERPLEGGDQGDGNKKPGTYVVLSVADTGVGMGSETIQKIFEPYYTTKDPSQGTGLGLAVAHGIVRELGGWIEVDSALGKGTRFAIWLPKDATSARALVPTAEPSLAEGTERLLVVDDELANVKVMQNGLSRLGYKVHGFTIGREALEFVRAHPGEIDAALVDLTMPELTGLELARGLREIVGRRVLILLWSGLIEDQTVTLAEEIPIDLLLDKPASPREVARALRSLIAQPQTQPQSSRRRRRVTT